MATFFPILFPVKRLHFAFPSLVISKLTIQFPASSFPNSEINARGSLISPLDIAGLEYTRYNSCRRFPSGPKKDLLSHNILYLLNLILIYEVCNNQKKPRPLV